jgi:formylmethanofuran dehydrogenase subunit E
MTFLSAFRGTTTLAAKRITKIVIKTTSLGVHDMRSRLAPLALVLLVAAFAAAQDKKILEERPTQLIVFGDVPKGWKPRAAAPDSKKTFLHAFDLEAAEGEAEGPHVDVLYFPLGFQDYEKKLLPGWSKADGTPTTLDDHKTETFEANDLKVRTVEVGGTYTHKDAVHKGWSLVAAHIRAPGGQWSAWLIGPEKGVAKHRAAYLDWVKTVKLGPPESEAVREVRFVHGAPEHGVPGPWALSGYRIGKNALGRLGITREKAWEIVVTHRSPKKVQFTCLMEGLLAATGASPGKLNLVHEEVGEDALETIVTHKPSGKVLTYRLTKSFREKIGPVARADFPQAAAMLEALKDEEVFSVTEGAKTEEKAFR